MKNKVQVALYFTFIIGALNSPMALALQVLEWRCYNYTITDSTGYSWSGQNCEYIFVDSGSSGGGGSSSGPDEQGGGSGGGSGGDGSSESEESELRVTTYT